MHAASLVPASSNRRAEPSNRGTDDPPLVRISIGEVYAAAQPTMLQTVLGSCVAVCLLDPVAGVGGMNHILLPEALNRDQSSRFGVHAMELLINKMMQLGADRRRFLAKSFGAGNVLACLTAPTVGEKNAQFVHDFLAMERIPLLAQRLGGTDAVRVNFRTDTGRVIIRSVSGSPLSAIVAREKTFLKVAPSSASDDQDVTLF
jgi:chemotaxis receptor (MCP) glutamine deamidase CheD